MAEYDAFGRKKGDDPLEQLGSTPAPAPDPAAAPVSAPPPARRSSKAFPVAIAVALVVVMASIGAAVSLLASSTEEGVLEPVPVKELETLPGQAPGTAAGSEEPRGLDEGSLLTRPVLERAVKAMRVAELGRPVSFRVAAGRVDAQLVTSKGRLRSVQVGPAGVPREISVSEAGNVPSMPWSAVDPHAPQRLVRAAAEREKRSAHDVDYLVLLDLGEPTWGLFFKGGTHYQGDAAGRITRRVSP